MCTHENVLLLSSTYHLYSSIITLNLLNVTMYLAPCMMLHVMVHAKLSVPKYAIIIVLDMTQELSHSIYNDVAYVYEHLYDIEYGIYVFAKYIQHSHNMASPVSTADSAELLRIHQCQLTVHYIQRSHHMASPVSTADSVELLWIHQCQLTVHTFNIAIIWLHQYLQMIMLSYYVSINAS